jgi:hypothetical protein
VIFKAWIPLLFVAVACKRDPEPQPDKLLDTGWFTDTAAWTGDACTHRFVSSVPEAGVADWYYRDVPRINVATEARDRYEAFVVDQFDVQVPTEMVWSEFGLSFDLNFVDGLLADHRYEIHVRDCLEEVIIPFRTSELGVPLESGPAGLVGNTYVLDLNNADWKQPAGLGPLLALYFTTPVLLGVEDASAAQIDWLGAPGRIDTFDGIVQDETQAAWDFAPSDFSTHPFFDSRVDEVVFLFDGVEIPVRNFKLEGTFSSDGRGMGGTVLQGEADTRNLGGFLGEPDNPGAMCEYAASLGVSCQRCDDGEPVCLDMLVTGVDASLLPGVQLKKR